MEYDWYNVFNLPDFEAEGLVSKKLEVVLDGIGEAEILITKGNTVAILYDEVFLPVNFLGNNPFARDGYAVYKGANGDVWLGVEQGE